jgi:ABC-type lipoprotein release transport system permease subunit
MGAVRMLARMQIRRRWGSIALLTLLVGFVGVVVLASVAGARRTASSLERFETASSSADVEVDAGDATAEQLREFRRTPNVVAVGALRQLTLFGERQGFLPTAGPTDSTFGRTVDRARLVAGREARAVDELTIGEGLTSKLGVGIGDRLTFQSFSPEQISELDDSNFEPKGPTVTFRIVGIVRRPLDLGGRGAAGGVIVPTRAFVDAYRDRIGSFSGAVLRVRTAHGQSDVPQVVAAARRIFGRDEQFGTLGLAIEGQGAQGAIDVTTAALWILAGVAALAGLVAIALALARYMAHVAVDQDTLSALGLRPRQRWAATVVSAVPIALGAAVLAVVGAVLASPLFPMGVARDAEPTPGVDVDAVVLGAGFLAVLTLVLAVGAVAAAVTTARRDADFSRPALPTAAASRAGLPSTMATGIGFALERGGGAGGGVPVRSSLAGASFGVLGVVAALLFAASLDHLVSTPRLFGWTWDVIARDASTNDAPCAPTRAFARDPAVDAVTSLCLGNVEVDGHPVPAYGFRRVRGHIGPAIVEGRAPHAGDEVALGATTLADIGKQVGDSVRVTPARGSRRFRIVGRSVFPTIATSDAQPLADGVVFTADGMRRAHAISDGYLVVRLRPNVNRADALARLQRAGEGFTPVGSTTPAEVERLQQIDRFPAVLAAFAAGVALVAIGYALVTAVRRRGRDLAILKTLGYRRGQVRATVAWHATTVAVIGLAVGIPLGIVVGRLVWAQVADGLGVSTSATIPAPALLVVAVVVLLLVNLAAALPARAAARTRPAVVLRSE